MENRVSRTTLSKWLKRVGSASWNLALGIVEQVVLASDCMPQWKTTGFQLDNNRLGSGVALPVRKVPEQVWLCFLGWVAYARIEPALSLFAEQKIPR